MKKLSHQEILDIRKTAQQALQDERHPVSLIIHNVRSLYNVGSIFRSADSALIEKLYLTGYTPHPPRKEIEKTALGAVDTVPWEYCKSPIEVIEKLKSDGISVMAVEITDNGKMYDTLMPGDYPLALVLGNELTGLEDEVIDACQGAIEVPMYGVKHSLNVSVCTGIVIFEAVRIWRGLRSKEADNL